MFHKTLYQKESESSVIQCSLLDSTEIQTWITYTHTWLFVRLILGVLLLGTGGGIFSHHNEDNRITRSSKVKATTAAPAKLI